MTLGHGKTVYFMRILRRRYLYLRLLHTTCFLGSNIILCTFFPFTFFFPLISKHQESDASIISPDSDHNNSHCSKMLKTVTVELLQILAIEFGYFGRGKVIPDCGFLMRWDTYRGMDHFLHALMFSLFYYVYISDNIIAK